MTLGYAIYDSCEMQHTAVQNALNIISGTEKMVPNYNCYKNSKLLGIVGNRLFSSTISIASITGLYRYPQISYGARNAFLKNKLKDTSLYHTFPGERSQYR
ncbi:unnamed protein product, partial [Staurois parvus]